MVIFVKQQIQYLASTLVSSCFWFSVRSVKLTKNRKIISEGLYVFL